MVQTPRANPAPDVRALVPRDLFDQAHDGALVCLSMKVQTIHLRTTSGGREWAVIDGLWRGHRLRCVAFPNFWEAAPHPRAGAGVMGRGQVSFRDAVATIWLHQLNCAVIIEDLASQPDGI